METEKTNLALTYSKSYFKFLSKEMERDFRNQCDFFPLSLFQTKKERYPAPETSWFITLKPRKMHKTPRQLLFILVSFKLYTNSSLYFCYYILDQKTWRIPIAEPSCKRQKLGLISSGQLSQSCFTANKL